MMKPFQNHSSMGFLPSQATTRGGGVSPMTTPSSTPRGRLSAGMLGMQLPRLTCSPAWASSSCAIWGTLGSLQLSFFLSFFFKFFFLILVFCWFCILGLLLRLCYSCWNHLGLIWFLNWTKRSGFRHFWEDFSNTQIFFLNDLAWLWHLVWDKMKWVFSIVGLFPLPISWLLVCELVMV